MLPTERELARELRCSRMSISKALQQLTDEGLIRQRVGSGTWVCDGATRILPPGIIAIVYRAFDNGLPSGESDYIINGIRDVLDAASYAYEMVPFSETLTEGEKASESTLRDLQESFKRHYGGCIFVEGLLPALIERLHENTMPLVVANMEKKLNVSATWVDHRRIACSAVNILAALGHRRIGLVVTQPDRGAFYDESILGYQDGLKQAGLMLDEGWIVLCENSSPEAAYTVSKKLFAQQPPPTAIIAGRDLHAEGIFRAAKERNLMIGRDLSVVGYDDLSSSTLSTILTTFREPCYELGAEAGRLLMQAIESGSSSVVHREIAAPLMLRKSAGPPADGGPMATVHTAQLHYLSPTENDATGRTG